MTSREIVERALLKQQTERMPCFPLIDSAFASAYARVPLRELECDPETHARALTVCADHLPVDGLYVNICLSGKQAAKPSVGNGGVLLDEALELKIPLNDVMSITHTDIVDMDDERIQKAELFHPGMRETMKFMPDRIKEKQAVCVGISGTFTQGAFLFGIERFMISLIDNPEGVRAMLDRRHEQVLRQASELLDDGARFIWIGEGPASGSLISPEFYRSFALPYEISLTDHIRRRGGLSILHICGNTRALLPDIAKSGADGLDLDYPVELTQAFDAVSPAMAVKGNINPILFLPGKETELTEAAVRAAAIGGGRRGFIMSTGCLVPRDSSLEAFGILAEVCGIGGHGKQSR